jgi:DNA-binding response OmpR family regulator
VLILEYEVVLAEGTHNGVRREAMSMDIAYDGNQALRHLALVAYHAVLLSRRRLTQ